jgi:hypothetical protein
MGSIGNVGCGDRQPPTVAGSASRMNRERNATVRLGQGFVSPPLLQSVLPITISIADGTVQKRRFGQGSRADLEGSAAEQSTEDLPRMPETLRALKVRLLSSQGPTY